MAKYLALHTLLALFVLVSKVAAEEGGQKFTAEREQTIKSNKLTVWVVDPLIKVFRNDVSGKQESFEASTDVARGEVGTLQAVVVSPEPIKNLSSRLSDLSVEGKPSDKLTGRARFVGYVPVTSPMSPPQGLHAVPGDFPDPLLENPAIDVAANNAQPIWVTVSVPTNAVPGVYRGSLSIAASIGADPVAMKVPVAVQVHDVTVGKTRLWVVNWGPFDPFRTYYENEPKMETWSNEFWTSLRRYARNMADHRQNVVFTAPLKLIDFRIGKGGDLEMDFARFDRWVKIFIEEGVIGRIEGVPFASRSGWEAPITVSIVVREENGDQTKCIEVAPTDPRADQFYGRFLPKYWGHLCEKGWDKMYIQHICDEAITANVQSFLAAAVLIHKYAPDFQIVDTAHSQLGRGKAFEDWAEKVNICVASPDTLDGNTKRMQQLYVSQKNRELWFYTCWMPQGSYANRFIEQKLLATRLLHWMNFRYKATGYLHWGYNMWNTPDPFKFVIHPKGEHPKVAGDAWIVYPGKNGPLDSIRHEAMRDGIADHELLSMLQERNPEAAERLAGIMVQSFTEYNTDVKVFRDTRRELLKQLSGNDRRQH